MKPRHDEENDGTWGAYNFQLNQNEVKAILEFIDHEYVPGDNIILRNLIQRMLKWNPDELA